MLRLTVRLTPRADANRIDGPDEQGALRVRVRAAPADGAANEALLRLIAETLGVPRSAVSMAGGASARTKLIAVDDLARQRIELLWPGLVR
jgi:uncharacterized protein YggU (UPF0235/DUF167 family)